MEFDKNGKVILNGKGIVFDKPKFRVSEAVGKTQDRRKIVRHSGGVEIKEG